MSKRDTIKMEMVKLSNDHIDEIMQIEVEAYPDAWSRNMFVQELKLDKSYFFVALSEGKVIGYAGFWLILDEAHITSLTIRNDYRGHGLGRDLLRFILDMGIDANATMATLEVRETNISACSLYKKMGFDEVGIRKNYYPSTGEDAIVMLKELSQSDRTQNDGLV